MDAAVGVLASYALNPGEDETAARQAAVDVVLAEWPAEWGNALVDSSFRLSTVLLGMYADAVGLEPAEALRALATAASAADL